MLEMFPSNMEQSTIQARNIKALLTTVLQPCITIKYKKKK